MHDSHFARILPQFPDRIRETRLKLWSRIAKKAERMASRLQSRNEFVMQRQLLEIFAMRNSHIALEIEPQDFESAELPKEVGS